MGCTGSKLTPEEKRQKARDKAIQKAMMERKKEEQRKVKMLLLGTGESGKSTMLKQMQNLYGEGFSPEERKGFRPIIMTNIMQSMYTLLGEASKRGEDISAAGVDAATTLAELKKFHDADISVSLAENISKLWANAGIQRVYELRAEFQLTDSAAYFFNKVKEVVAPDFLPSVDDVLRSRVRTTGIVENKFEIENTNFLVFDVGGQRSERRKWIACFQDVDAVMFVGVLSEYDLVLFEDNTTNRMVESMNLFEDIVSNNVFKNTGCFILMLNKSDLFMEKIGKVPLSMCPVFAEMEAAHAHDPDLCKEAIKKEFETRVPVIDKDKLTVHYTCATDTKAMEAILESVRKSIIRGALDDAGLM